MQQFFSLFDAFFELLDIAAAEGQICSRTKCTASELTRLWPAAAAWLAEQIISISLSAATQESHIEICAIELAFYADCADTVGHVRSIALRNCKQLGQPLLKPHIHRTAGERHSPVRRAYFVAEEQLAGHATFSLSTSVTGAYGRTPFKSRSLRLH